MTLIEFLLARIDEDEVALHELFDEPRPVIGRLDGPFHLTRARLLEDLATKRTLIESASLDGWTDPADVDPVDHRADLAVLAMPYSGHPDYRQEWRL